MKKSKERVSIIVVSHNNKEILPKVLESVRRQTYKNFRVYLLDNDSTDGTDQFIKEKYPEVEFTDISEGPSEKRNIGIKQSQGEYIVALDSDVILSKDWIKSALEYMEEHKEVGLCGGKLIGESGLIDTTGGQITKSGSSGAMEHEKEDRGQANSFKKVAYLTTAAVIMRRKMIEEIGGFDKDYFYGNEDSDLGLRANLSGWKVIYNPDLIATHLWHSTVSKQSSKKMKFYRKNRFVTLLKNFELKTLLLNSPKIFSYLIYNLSKPYKLPTLKGYLWIPSNLGNILKKRKRVFEKRKITDRELFDKIYFPYRISSQKQNKISSFLRKINSKSLKNVTFFITTRCNSRCKHCFYWKDLNQKADLSLKEISKILSKFHDIDSFTLSGGEPFIRQDIDEVIKLIVKYTGVKTIHIPTNGLTDISSRLEKILKENPFTKFSIKLSLDGFEEDHEYIRGIKGNFDKVVKLSYKLKKIQEKYPNFSSLVVHTVVIDRNYKSMPKFIKFVKTLPVNTHTCEIMRGDHQQVLTPLNAEQVKKFNNMAQRVSRSYTQSKPFLTRIFSNLKVKEMARVQSRVLEGKKWPFDCTAGVNDFVIESDGSARMCELQPKIGDLLKNTPEEGLKSPEARKIFNQIKNHKCDCTHSCNISSSINHSAKNIFFDRIIHYR